MSSTYSTNLRTELIGSGDQPGTWGNTTNGTLGSILEQAIAGVSGGAYVGGTYPVVNFPTDANITLTANNGSVDQSRSAVLVVTSTGSLTATRSIVAPASASKIYIIKNSTTGGQSIVIKYSASTGVTIGNGQIAFVYGDGTEYYNVISSSAGNFAVAGNLTVSGTTTSIGAISSSAGVSGTTGTFSGGVSGTTGTFSGAVSGAAISGTTAAFSADGTFSGTGQVKLPAGTTAQRSGSPISGMIRYNSSNNNFEGYANGAWGSIGGGATGGGGDQIFVQNGQTVTASYTIPTSFNASTVGPVSINSGITVTIPSGSRWVVL
jgi:hypothetical protein